MDAEQFRRRQHAHLFRDERAPITALRHVSRVAEALHQHGPGARHARGVPAGGRRLARETVARHRRNHHMERIRCAAAMRRGIGQRIDELHLLDDRAGPSVRDDDRQRIFMFRTDVDEMNVQPVDLGDEIRHGVQSRLARAPVVFRPPIARELLNRRELYALRRIGNRFLLRPDRWRLCACANRQALLPESSHETDEWLSCHYPSVVQRHPWLYSFLKKEDWEDLPGPQQRLPLQHRKSDGD